MHKRHIVVIHGGGNFIPRAGEAMLEIIGTKTPTLDSMRRTPDWKALLQERLGEMYDVLSPRMPNADAPRYEEWKLWFEKILPLFNEDALFVGHSLGGMFLAKYFSETPAREYVQALFLVAPPFDALGYAWEFGDISTLASHVGAVFFYHSKDDEVVPFDESKKFRASLPNAVFRELDGRGHFIQDNVPEIVDDIKSV